MNDCRRIAVRPILMVSCRLGQLAGYGRALKNGKRGRRKMCGGRRNGGRLPSETTGEGVVKHVPTKTGGIGREGVQRLLRTNPEFAEAYWAAMEMCGAPRPKPVVEVLVKVVGPTAEKVRDNPSALFVGVREPNGVTTFERNPNYVTVLAHRVLEVDSEGRPIYPASGATHVYDPFDALKG
jgi:hypothetical protein